MSFSVHKASLELDLIAKVEPVVVSLGYALRDLEIIGSGASAIVRVTLDKPKNKNTTPQILAEGESHSDATALDTIGIEDCSKVHQLLGPMFDVWDPLPHAYSLEVTSPGEKPNLRTLEHFAEALGQKIHFQTLEAIPMPAPMKPRRNWEGELKELSESTGELILKDGYGEHRIALNKIKTATWLREWTPGGNSQGNSPKGHKKPHPKAKEGHAKGADRHPRKEK